VDDSLISHQTIPIPGSSSPSRVLGNCDAANVKFTDEEIGKINQILSSFELKGDRYMAGLHSLSVSHATSRTGRGSG
jgi:diketogulonate reductase-like aldo/keto reductase